MFLNLGLSVSLLLVIVAFEWRTYDDSGLLDLGMVQDDFEDLMEIPPTEQPPPPPPQPFLPLLWLRSAHQLLLLLLLRLRRGGW